MLFLLQCPISSMWKFLYQLASPKTFYHLTRRLKSWLVVIACLALPIGLIWGLVFAPPDYQQGEAYRIIYVHVPCAFLSLSLYAWMGFLAVLVLVWRIKIAGLLLSVVAEFGAAMAFLALVTGGIWGKPMWGAWWVWDARLTSELVLLLMYIAILLTSQLAKQKAEGDRLVAILTLVGVLDLPVIHYSVYWWNTLHQGASLSLLAKPSLHSSMLYPLLITWLGFVAFCLFGIFDKAGYEVLLRERRQTWVRAVIEEKST